MSAVRLRLHVPALFVGASDWLVEEHAALEPLAEELNARINTLGEEARRHEELDLRRRIDAYLSRYTQEGNQRKDIWEQRAKIPTSYAASMAKMFAELLAVVDATPNRQAIEQIEELLGCSIGSAIESVQYLGTSSGRTPCIPLSTGTAADCRHQPAPPRT